MWKMLLIVLGIGLFISGIVFSQEQVFMPEETFRLSSELVSPHIPWAKPYLGKKITALVLAPRYRQRETLELAQRLEIKCIPVLLYSKHHLWQEGWNWGFERVKEFSKEYCLSELKEGINSSYDVIIIGQAPLDKFPPDLIEKIKTKVFSGTGLVYVYENPYGGGKPWDGFKELMVSPTEEGKEFITAGIPFEFLPGFWQVKTKEGKIDLSRTLSLYKYGEGRVVMVNYRNLGGHFLTPADDNDLNYEYYQAFLIKTILWAGKNEPKILFKDVPGKQSFGVTQKIPEMEFNIVNSGSPVKVKVSLSIRSEKPLYKLPVAPLANFGVHQTASLIEPIYQDTKKISCSKGETKIAFSMPQLPAGKYFVDVEISADDKKINWATVPVEINKEDSAIAKIKTEPDSLDITKEKEVNVKVILLEPLKEDAKLNLSVIDNYDRILSKKEINLNKGEILIEARLPITGISTTLGRVRGELYIGDKLVSIETEEFTVFNRGWDDFTFFAWTFFGWWGHMGMDYIGRQRARIAAEYGIDAFRGTASFETLRVADMRGIPDIWRFVSGVKDKKYVEPCYSDPENRIERAKIIKSAVEKNRPFDPFGFLYGDEFMFINGGLPGGCHSDSCIKSFRKYLENQYKTIGNLNNQWDTRYASFDEIMPLDEESVNKLMEKAKSTKNYSYLIDQWLYNYFIFADMMRFCQGALKEVDPEEKIRIGYSTPLWNWYWRAYDWASLMRYATYVTPYGPWVDIEQREAMRSFAKEGTILSAHYGSYVGDGQIVDEARQRMVPYVLLFNRCSNVFWYHLGQGGETGISPSLEPYPAFKGSSEEIRKIKNGLGKLLLSAKTVNNSLAIYWSIPSYLFSFLVSGPVVSWRLNTLIYALEEMGYQFDFVSPEQLKEGKLENYKVLFLPISQCIGKDEAEAIKRFVENGGVVIADVKPGNFDEHGKVWKKSPLSELFGVKSKDPLQPVKNIQVRFNGKYRGITFSGPLLKEVEVDPSLVLDGARSVLDINGVPLITYKDYGKGTAICLNTVHTNGEPEVNNNFRNLLGVLLSAHNINPEVKIKTKIEGYTPGRFFIPGLEFTHFRDGEAEYFALTRRKTKTEGDKIKGLLSINFGQSGHLYDVLGGKYLGYKDNSEVEISPYEVQLYTLLPYKVEGIEIKLDKKNYAPGEYIKGEVSLKLKAEAEPVRHIINLQVKRPDGKMVRYLRQNLETEAGKVAFKIPLALNEPKGDWELLFTDTATKVKNNTKVKVK